MQISYVSDVSVVTYTTLDDIDKIIRALEFVLDSDSDIPNFTTRKLLKKMHETRKAIGTSMYYDAKAITRDYEENNNA